MNDSRHTMRPSALTRLQAMSCEDDDRTRIAAIGTVTGGGTGTMTGPVAGPGPAGIEDDDATRIGVAPARPRARMRHARRASPAAPPDAAVIRGASAGSSVVTGIGTPGDPADAGDPNDATVVNDATRITRRAIPIGTISSAVIPSAVMPSVMPSTAAASAAAQPTGSGSPSTVAPAAARAVCPPTDAELHAFRQAFIRLTDAVAAAIVGKERPVRECVIALIAGGHLLLEDVPGTGKTLLARTLARAIDVSFRRIQFTPDLLPSDVTGMSVLDRDTGTFSFREGPVFASIVLADEINRASPKTQSALLEVMEEGHVTVDGMAHAVPSPFMVIATQNPSDQLGTYRLPEAQLDRFLIATSIGHPDRATGVSILRRMTAVPETAAGPNQRYASAPGPVLDAAQLATMRGIAARVHCDDRILEYMVRLTEATRHRQTIAAGSSIRGALALLRAARALAASEGRAYVTPSDVAVLAGPALAHRITLSAAATFEGRHADEVIAAILGEVPAPDGETS